VIWESPAREKSAKVVLVSGVEQVRNADGSAASPHPAFKPHPMQGWTPDFIPKLTEDAVNMKVIHKIIPIAGNEAIKWSGELARREGIFVGITAGATFAGALKVAAGALKRTVDEPRRQRDLSVSYNRVGEVVLVQGKLNEALKAYHDGLDIRDRFDIDQGCLDRRS
jgi:cysteine synthase